MKKTILFFVLIITSFNFCLAQEWFTSLDVAKKLALVQNKMLFVMWEDSFNYQYPVLIDDGKGGKMVTDLFEDESINSLIWDYFIPVKIYESEYEELSHQIKETRGTKYYNKLINDRIKIMDVNGNILNINASYAETLENISSFFKLYALDTSYLKQELINYSKNKDLVTSFNLATKYLDFAVSTEKEIRLEIIQLANIYFDEAKNHLTKSDLKNKKGFLQNCDLQKIKEYLILNKPKKVIRHLKKLDVSEINKINLSLFSSLYYTAYRLTRDEDKANLWKSNMSSADLNKANLILNINY